MKLSSSNWAEHLETWDSCEACELHETRKKVVLGMGRLKTNACPALYLVIGKHPGEDEDSTGLPMQGMGGKWTYWALCKLAGISWNDCFFTNILGCKPKTTSRQSFVHACTPRVHDIIQLVEPRLIISMGLVAGKFFTGDNKVTMTALSGSTSRWGTPLLPNTYEIFYVMHPLEPAHQQTLFGKKESEKKVARDFRKLRERCIELGLIERVME